MLTSVAPTLGFLASLIVAVAVSCGDDSQQHASSASGSGGSKGWDPCRKPVWRPRAIRSSMHARRIPAARLGSIASTLAAFHYTPTSGSWLNQVEGFFGILTKQSLSLTHFPSKKALREHIEAF